MIKQTKIIIALVSKKMTEFRRHIFVFVWITLPKNMFLIILPTQIIFIQTVNNIYLKNELLFKLDLNRIWKIGIIYKLCSYGLITS